MFRRLARPRPAGTTPPAILDAYYKLMTTDSHTLPKPAQVLAAVVCDLFLDHSQKHHSSDTFTNYRHFLQSFYERCGGTPAADLKPFQVTRWLDAHPKWKGPGGTPSSPSSERSAGPPTKGCSP